jgi:hypothetical protein
MMAVISPRHRRAALAACLGAGAAMLAWIGWCQTVAGQTWPNAQYIKGQGGGVAGLEYVGQHVLPGEPWLVSLTGAVLLVLAIARDARARRYELAALALAIAGTIVAIALSRPLHPGTLFYESRYFAPLSALWPVVLVFGLPARPRWAAPVLLVPLALVTGLELVRTRSALREHELDTRMVHTVAALHVADRLPPDAVVAVEGAGAVRYFAPRTMTIVDLVGLNDHRAAQLHFQRGAKLCHVLSRGPTHLLVPRAWVPLFSPPLRLAALAAFDDPSYTQVEPPHPHGVLLLAVQGVDPAFAAACAGDLVPSAP